MKTLLLSFILFCSCSVIQAQITVKRDSTGNFVYTEKTHYCDSITGLTLTLKTGEEIPVFVTPSGAYFIISDSKKYRRIYLNQK